MIKVNGILDSQQFLRDIDALTSDGTDYMDAVVDYCQKNSIEIETAAAIIRRSEVAKSRLQQEAEDLNLLPKTPKLPV
jgi:hypothetical protein